MSSIPPEILELAEQGEQIQVDWEPDELSTKVTASFGEATVTVETTHEGRHVVPWLVASMPNILDAAWTAMQAEADLEEGAEPSQEEEQ